MCQVFDLPHVSVAAGRGGAVFTAFVSMPEAAVDEDGGFVFGEEDVNGNRTS